MTRLDPNISEKSEPEKKDFPKPEFTTAAQYAASRKKGVPGTPLREQPEEEAPEEIAKTTFPVMEPPPVAESVVKEATEEEPPPEEIEEEPEELYESDKLDVYATSNSVAHKWMMSKDRRKRIEKGLEALDIGDLIASSGIKQTIEAVPGKIKYVLKSISQEETLFCYKYVTKQEGSAFFAEEMLKTCRLVCMATALNGSYFAPHSDGDGEVSEELFEQKFKQVARLPDILISDLSIQADWFQDRVASLFNSFDSLKNG